MHVMFAWENKAKKGQVYGRPEQADVCDGIIVICLGLLHNTQKYSFL